MKINNGSFENTEMDFGDGHIYNACYFDNVKMTILENANVKFTNSNIVNCVMRMLPDTTFRPLEDYFDLVDGNYVFKGLRDDR